MTDKTGINATQAIILAVLHEGPAIGAHIEAEARKLDGHWNVTRSQVYRELPEMAKLGYVVRHDPDPGARWSDPYTLTEAGKSAYQDWFMNAKLSTITRDPWMLRQRLSEYTGITTEEAQMLRTDALEALQEALLAESAKPAPDPVLLSRYQTALLWFSGSLA